MKSLQGLMFTSRKTPLIRAGVLTFFVFLVLYNISFLGHESLTTGRFSVVILLLWATLEGRNFFGVLKTKAWLLLLPLPAVLIQYIAVPDFGQFSRFLHLALYAFLGAALFSVLARDVKLLAGIMLAAVSVQALILIVSFFSHSYRNWFDTIVYTGSNYGADYIYRAPGFSSDGGAALSVVQSFGVLLGWVLIRPNEYFSRISGSSAYLVYVAMALSALSCIVVGRTGVVMCSVFLLLVILNSRSRKQLFFISSFLAFSLYLAFSVATNAYLGNDFSLDYFSGWAFGFLSGNDETVSTLAGMNIPNLTSETFFGTGLSSVTNGANPSGNDSGFIQAYYSMGLVFASILYGAYLFVLLHVLRWLRFKWRIPVVMIMFGIEAKEPFLFKYSAMFILMSLYFGHRFFSSQTVIKPIQA